MKRKPSPPPPNVAAQAAAGDEGDEEADEGDEEEDESAQGAIPGEQAPGGEAGGAAGQPDEMRLYGLWQTYTQEAATLSSGAPPFPPAASGAAAATAAGRSAGGGFRVEGLGMCDVLGGASWSQGCPRTSTATWK